MTKTKIKLTLGIFSVTLVVLVSGFHRDPDDSFMDQLKGMLKQYNRDFLTERTYLITDRFVYKPGEDLWFKGLVASTGEKRTEQNSEDFFIKLLNSKGQEIISRRYPLLGNQTTGRLMIPRTSIPGRYWLVAYTGWMKNQCPREAFRKEILISKYFDKRFQVEILYDKPFYYSGDSLKANLRILDPAGKPIPGINFEYILASFKRREIKSTSETDSKGQSKISCRIPESDEILMLTIEIRSRKLSGDYTYIIPAATALPEISFYPEGGKLVKGLTSLVAFMATANFGQPVSISGEIIDSRGNILKSVTTGTNGKGIFEYLPEEDTCFLRINRPSGLSKKFPLPIADKNGWIIHRDEQDSDSVKFSITSSGDTSVNTAFWVASMGHKIIWSKSIYFSKAARVGIPVRNLRNGILQVSVFNQHHVLAAERLVKIENSSVQLVVKTDHNIYRSRQRVNLSLELTGEKNSIDLAMLVSLRSLSTNPLMKGLNDIINFIPCDSSVRLRLFPDQWSDLDLLTTNYRTVYWDQVLKYSTMTKTYRRYDGISGQVFDRKDNLSQNAKVRVTHIPNYRSYETQTDETGTFHVVFGSDIIDFNYLNIDAYDALGKVNLTATINQDFSENVRSEIAGEGETNDRQKTIDVISYGEPDLVYALRFGPGKFRKSIPEAKKKYDPNQYARYTNVLDIIQDIKPYRLINNTIVFAPDEDNYRGAVVQEGVIIVINGALKGYNVGILKNILPSDITNINISTSLLDVHKYSPMNFQGVIEITTIQGMYKYRQPTVLLGIDILKTNRVFYSPDYSVESTTASDNRKTLYWNPQIILQSGNSTLVSFYTSDIKGNYYGLIEGIDETGNPVRAEFSFVVE